MDIKLQNTLSGEKDTFEPIESGVVKMYHCGPTVYGKQHIGNLSMYVFTDILRRTLEYAGYDTKQVINITDFGHLSSDADEGEDKMTKGLKAEGLELNMENMRRVAEKYADIWKSDLKELNIKEAHEFPFASDYIAEQIELIEKLEEKGFAYTTSLGVYFDTAKFPNYGKLNPHFVKDSAGQARIGENNEKKNQKDFALWKFSGNSSNDKDLGWSSKWGRGFPGWHIECTAMIFSILGEQIDIHTGGIEHIGVHHNNEIAQAEAASDKSPFSKYWLHREHLRMNEEKIAKSTGNVVFLSDLKKHKIHPLSFRYLLLTSSYRTPMNFTWEAVEGAQNALESIIARYLELPEESDNKDILEKFEEAISDDLGTPIALSLLQEANSKETINKMDSVLGLNIQKLAEEISDIPEEIKSLQKEREEARENKDFAKSDELRSKIENSGYTIKDTSNKTLILRTLSSLV